MSESKKVILLGSDAGGTMTDMILVDSAGEFIVGKASTTHQNESIGFINSVQDALENWEIDPGPDDPGVFPDLMAAFYSGTTMLNTLLTRTGKKVGIIITKGFEDTLTLLCSRPASPGPSAVSWALP